MREIKLRGLDRNDGLVKEIERIDFKNEIALFVGEYGWVEFNNVELEQFTGLHDKNGVEIYENDKLIDNDEGFFIVRYDDKTARFVLDLYGIKGCLMEYGFDETVGDVEVIDTYSFNDFYGTDNFEVIGNIHEVQKYET